MTVQTMKRLHRASVGFSARGATLALCFFMAFVSLLQVSYLNDRINSSNTVNEKRVDALSTALGQEQKNVTAEGGTPVAPAPSLIVNNPEIIQGAQGVRGNDGSPGRAPTIEEIRTAVAYVLATQPDLTKPQIISAVTTYFALNPPAPGLNGLDGAPGSVGPQGPQGEVGPKGDTGPPVTAEQIATQVANYLTDNPPAAGPKGDKGDTGAAGEPGPSCPADYTAQPHTLLTDEGPQDVILCVKDQ